MVIGMRYYTQFAPVAETPLTSSRSGVSFHAAGAFLFPAVYWGICNRAKGGMV